MSDIFEVVVVGAGMFGSAAAKHLSRSGADVLVIGPAEPRGGDPVSQYAFGAYFDEARITRRLGWDAVWGTTDARSLERFRDIESESGVRFFHECGSLVLMAKSIGHKTVAILRQCQADGIVVERLREEELRAEFPGLGVPPFPGGAEGLLEREQAGYLNPRRLVQAQLALTVAAGGRVLRAAVTGIRKEEGSGLWRLRVAGDGGDRQIRAEKVLIATGALTNHNNVLPAGCELALYAFTEPNLLFEVGDHQLDRLRHLPALVTVDPEDTGDDNMSLYMLPPIRYPDGRWYMRIGPGMQPLVEELRTVEEMVSWYARQEITSRQQAFLTSMMQMLVPELKPESVRPACCIIEKTPSRYPYIGRVEDGLTVAVGGNGHGARGSDEIGRLASTVVLGEAWDCPVPQEVFAPITADAAIRREGGRPEFLKPPFGLC
ncbi:FAD-dependent oxidoreductase [Microbispora sp. NPDC046933]|uniref:NAD(P)/FAD-dependent oxidoreductase n=1 Tax=Microbispora sp. NPDC046933 TaxID=3155618 RepID=UPI0033EA5C7D